MTTAVAVRDASERRVLPIMGMVTTTEKALGDDGETIDTEVNLVETRSESMRLCDSCFLKDKCPAFKPQTNCAYDIPVTVKTKTQMAALQNAIIEMQSQRVMFMRMAEEMEGGYADPNLSNEVDRLQKMIKVKTELESDTFSVKFEAKGSTSQAGVISRLFGRDAADRATALPEPISADRAITDLNVIDAEVIDVPKPY